MRLMTAIILVVGLTSCNVVYYLMDTTSDTVYEYKNDYYVSKIDTLLEFHYELWSRDATLWLSTLNRTNKILFLALDSTYIMHDDEKYYFDFLVDWPEYSRRLAIIPGLTDYDLNKVLPLVPNQWKGMLGEPIPTPVEEWAERDPVTVYTKEDSPWKLEVQVCFYEQGNAFTPICKRDEIWVESFTPVDASTIRSLELDSDFKKADKFFITNSSMGY